MFNGNHATVVRGSAAAMGSTVTELPTRPERDRPPRPTHSERVPSLRPREALAASATRTARLIAAIAAGSVAGTLGWMALRAIPAPVALDGLAAFIGIASMLYLGLAGLSDRPVTCACNLAAGVGIFAWGLLTPSAPWALAIGLLLHASACGFNAWQAGKTIEVGREPVLGLSASTLALASLTYAVGL